MKFNFDPSKVRDTSPAEELYRKLISHFPASGGGGAHTAILTAGNYARIAGIDRNEVYADLERVWSGARAFNPREVNEGLDKSFDESTGRADAADGTKREYVKKASLTPVANPHTTGELIRMGWETTEADLLRASPVEIPTDPVDQFELLMTSLYAPDDFVYTGNNFRTTVFTASQEVALAKERGFVPHSQIITNCFDGDYDENDSGRITQRLETSLFTFDTAVVEFDDIPVELMTPEQIEILNNWKAQGAGTKMPDELAMPKEWQYALWAAIQLPIIALIDSGGKSIHAWIAIDGVTSLEQWKHDIGDHIYRRLFDAMGADGACKNAGRQSRTVGHLRDNGNYQKLLYLNPAEKLGGDRRGEWVGAENLEW